MDIGREVRVIEVDEPAIAPDEIEPVLAREVGEEPEETGVRAG